MAAQTPAAGTPQAEHDAAIARARADGKAEALAEIDKAKAEAKAEGAAAERERIKGVEDAALPGFDSLVAEMKFDGKTTPGDAALRINRAHKESLAGKAKAIEDVEKHTGKVNSAPTGNLSANPPVAPVAQTKEGWRAEYERTPALQAEFLSADDYAAYKAAEAAGRVKILGNRAA